MKKSMENNPVTVGFVALGCPKNLVDSEKMLASIGQAGFVITADADNADVVVINTCGFITPAKNEALEAVRRAIKRKKRGAVGKVIVAGCLSQRMGKSLIRQAPDIDAVVGLGARDDIADIINKTLQSSTVGVYLPEHALTAGDDRGRFLLTPNHWAYLRISDGCDHKCSFCTIPAIRGKFRSKPQDLILAEAKELVENGAVELSLIAQDSNFYGRDLKIADGLSILLKDMAKIDGLEWIRLMYLYPSGIDEKLIETMSQTGKVLHYIDMPMQHINDAILKAMHRTDTKQKIQQLIERLRAAMPDVILRTTLMTGFPGETDEQFAELLDFVKWAKFEALGCFTFYAEQGTVADELPGQLPDKVKQLRADQIMAAQQEIVFAKNSARVGTKLTCLVDEVGSDGTGTGRFYGQAPHIDSVCIINNCTASPGQFINAAVTGVDGYDLILQ